MLCAELRRNGGVLPGIGEARSAILLLLIFALIVLAMLVLPRFLPYLGIDEERIVVFFSRRRRREIPCGDIAWISASRWCQMPSICICLRDSNEEFEIPYRKTVMDIGSPVRNLGLESIVNCTQISCESCEIVFCAAKKEPPAAM